jgi:hypothetical protein
MQEIIKKAEHDMKRATEATLKDFNSVRTGRASVALLDGIVVDYHGTPSPLKAVANLATPERRLITIQPWEPSVVPAVEKAAEVPKSPVKITNEPLPAAAPQAPPAAEAKPAAAGSLTAPPAAPPEPVRKPAPAESPWTTTPAAMATDQRRSARTSPQVGPPWPGSAGGSSSRPIKATRRAWRRRWRPRWPTFFRCRPTPPRGTTSTR